MKPGFHSLQLALVLTPFLGWSQSTLEYDQQTITADGSPGYGVGAGIDFYDSYSPWGQSFTPSLDAVGFIALPMDDPTAGFGGATVWVNLMSGSVSGPVIGSTEPINLTGGFNGTFYFYFPTAVAVTPGVQYYFTAEEAFGGTGVNIVSSFSDYPGSIYENGVPVYPGTSIFFREGIVVPEPASTVLVLLGIGALALFRGAQWKLDTS